MPHWFRFVVAAEIAGFVLLAVLLVRLAGSGVEAVGQVVDWAKPQIAQITSPASPRPVPPKLVLPGPALPSPHGQLDGLGQLGGPVFSKLDHDTAATANGEMRLITALEDVIRKRIEGAMSGPHTSR